MIKEYISWDRFRVGEFQYTHPTFVITSKFEDIKFEELGFSNGEKYLGIIEGEEDSIEEVIDYFKIHNMETQTVESALALCKLWYESEEFEFDVDGFTIIDNRPIDEFIE